MPIFSNSFTCPNGHTFVANAKLHTRCPECLTRVRRKVEKNEEPERAPETSTEHNEEKRKPILLRRGRQSVMAARKTTTTSTSRKPAASTVKKKTTPTSTIKKAPVKKPVAVQTTPSKIAGGIVKTRRVTGNVTPKITRTPQKTAVARFTKAGGGKRSGSYADEMMKRYGF